MKEYNSRTTENVKKISGHGSKKARRNYGKRKKRPFLDSFGYLYLKATSKFWESEPGKELLRVIQNASGRKNSEHH